MNMKTFRITTPDEALRPVLQNKIDNLNKPKGSMGRLEELALQIGLIQHTLSPELRHPCHLLFGADHGIEREGVSISPREITWQQMINFSRGGGRGEPVLPPARFRTVPDRYGGGLRFAFLSRYHRL